MRSLGFLFGMALASAPLSQATMSWAIPEYPPTTIENDGTFASRYDVRQTLAYVSNDTTNVNNVYNLYYVTTTDGSKYHVTTNAGLIGANTVGTFIALDDLSNGPNSTGRGGSIMLPGTGSTAHLNIRSAAQNVTSPSTGDKWTGTRHTLDFAGVGLDVVQQPTGMNFYYGGNGGIQLTPRRNSSVATVVPGWSWYWSNPFSRINGTLTIDDTTKPIDATQSFALFERQWGDFWTPGTGYYATWAYLETGEVLISWTVEPDLQGVGNAGFASVFHPSGLHEMMPVGPASYASDLTTSAATGKKYFNHFFMDLPARGANLTYTNWVRDGEIVPLLDEQKASYISISESYVEGVAFWNGKEVPFFGHTEQLSRL